jgi:hypothetical protein
MKRIRDAQTIIGALEGGDAAAELSREITETLAALKEQTGSRPKAKAKGKVILTLEIEVEAGAATITADIVSKRPKPVRGSSFYWVLDDGSLSTEHPQQMNMFGGPRDAEDGDMPDE